MKTTADPDVTEGSEGKARDRGGLRVLASTAPSMVRALSDAAFELTNEVEAIPLDDDTTAVQRPLNAVTGRRSLALRQHRVLATTSRGHTDAPLEEIELPQLVEPDVGPPRPRPGTEPRVGPPAATSAGESTASPQPSVDALAPRSLRARPSRRMLLAGLLAAGILAGALVAMSGGKVSPAPMTSPGAPSAQDLRPVTLPARSEAVVPTAPTDAPQAEAATAPAPEPSDTAPIPAAPEVGGPTPETHEAAPENREAPPQAEEAAPEVSPASPAPPQAAPRRSARVERIVEERQRAYEREFEERRRDRLRALAEQAARNRAIARERKQRYEDEFERRKRERLDSVGR